MSGSGPPPGPRPGPMKDDGSAPDCLGLSFTTTLASTDPGEVDSLRAGDILDVALIEEDGVTIIGVVQNDGAVIGSVVSGQMVQLKECLQRGFTYDAEVGSVDGGVIRVHISACE